MVELSHPGPHTGPNQGANQPETMPNEPLRILCISTYVKGQEFMRQCAEMGVKPTLLTVEKLLDADWPRDALEEIATMPPDLSIAQILNTVSWMMRGRRFDRVAALDEFDQEAAAAVREHTRIPGMGASTTACFRDKLAMRTSARRAGILVPQFCGIFNYDDLRSFMQQVDAPWLLKPRAEASALGIRRIHSPEQLWRTLEELGDEQSRFLLEQFVPGDIYHVDS
ncbi:MAG: ATPase, partial [Terracidiphilus sp.]